MDILRAAFAKGRASDPESIGPKGVTTLTHLMQQARGFEQVKDVGVVDGVVGRADGHKVKGRSRRRPLQELLHAGDVDEGGPRLGAGGAQVGAQDGLGCPGVGLDELDAGGSP